MVMEMWVKIEMKKWHSANKQRNKKEIHET